MKALIFFCDIAHTRRYLLFVCISDLSAVLVSIAQVLNEFNELLSVVYPASLCEVFVNAEFCF